MKHILFILITIMSIASVSAGKKQQILELQKQLITKDSLLSVNDSIYRLQLRICRDSLAVYEFFNTDEVSIFSNKALEINGKAKELSGKNKVKYETIRMIVDTETQLNKINENIAQFQEQREQKQWSEADLERAVALEIKADLYKVGDALDAIDKRDLSFLSKEQLMHYRELSKQFDKIYNRYL